MPVEPTVITLPVVTIDPPERMTDGRFRVEVKWSDKPTLTYRKFGDTEDEALSKASEAKHRYLAAFLKSQAAVHLRIAGRQAQARKARQAANVEAVAG